MSISEDTLKRIIENLEKCLKSIQEQTKTEQDISRRHKLIVQENHVSYCILLAKGAK